MSDSRRVLTEITLLLELFVEKGYIGVMFESKIMRVYLDNLTVGHPNTLDNKTQLRLLHILREMFAY